MHSSLRDSFLEDLIPSVMILPATVNIKITSSPLGSHSHKLSFWYIQQLQVQLVFPLKYLYHFSYGYLHFVVTVALYLTIFVNFEVIVFVFMLL